jgi:hypothetical protein
MVCSVVAGVWSTLGRTLSKTIERLLEAIIPGRCNMLQFWQSARETMLSSTLEDWYPDIPLVTPNGCSLPISHQAHLSPHLGRASPENVVVDGIATSRAAFGLENKSPDELYGTNLIVVRLRPRGQMPL